MTTRKALLLIVALAMGFPAAAQAQTALNQVRLAAAVTADDQRTVTLTVADSVSVGDVVFVDQEAMVATAVNTTSDVVTVARGALGTTASGHLANAVVFTGAANRFYFSDPKAGRCTAAQAYPGGSFPWINVLTGDAWYCENNTYGRAATVGGSWQATTLYPYMPSVSPYTPIAYRTSRDSNAAVITPAYTVKNTDMLVASLTYSGTFEIFLPAATGLLGKQLIIADAARLAEGSPSGRTVTIRGVIDGANNSTFSTVGAVLRLYVGISATSQYTWFSW